MDLNWTRNGPGLELDNIVRHRFGSRFIFFSLQTLQFVTPEETFQALGISIKFYKVVYLQK